MNRPLKRLLALAGSALIGAFGAVALASPAHAHHPIISGKAVCQADGQYEITWTVSNGDWSNPWMKIVEVDPTPDTSFTNIVVDRWLDKNGSVTDTQFVPGTTTHATLWVNAAWYKNKDDTQARHTEGRTGEVKMPGTCEKEEEPAATFASNCDGTVNVHIVNPAKGEAKFTVTGVDGEVAVPGGGEKDVTVPAGTAGPIVVKQGDKKIAENGGWVRPEECPKPSPLGESTCDSFTIQLTNPQGGQSTEATVTYGSQEEKVTVAPGKTETVELSPGSETEATVVFAGWNEKFIVKYEKPADCPGLPQTGDKVTTFVASGTGLAALGVLVFVLARRRLVKLRRLAS